MTNLPQSIVSTLPPEEHERLTRLLKEKGLPSLASNRILKLNGGSQLLPSFQQERLVFLQQFDPASWHYNMAFTVRLTGRLDSHALERAFDEVVSRHEVLNTAFEITSGNVQVIKALPYQGLLIDDLEILPAERRESEAQRRISQEARKPFDLSQGPLLRLKLLRLCADEHLLLLIVHHVVSDAWSMEVFARELSTLYEANCAGRKCTLPDLPIQYTDYAAWQREWVQGEVLETQVAYWRKQLAGAPVMELPVTQPRPRVQTHAGATYRFAIPDKIAKSILEVCRSEGATMFMVLLAAFDVLLHRYTGQTNVVVGTPISARHQVELEGLIGFFLNTVVLHTNLSGDPDFREVLQRAREVALGAYAHQDVPFEELVAELQTSRDPSRTPLFQVLLVVQHLPREQWRFTGLKASGETVNTGTAKFDLTLLVSEQEGSLSAELEYNTDLFDGACIRRLASHFENILEQALAHPDRRISELELLSDAEQRKIFAEWNDTGREYPESQCVHRLFETQVDRTPDATAVVWGNQQLNYRELNWRANQLARHLRPLGGAQRRVGIFLDRSLEMVVALIAVLKAGMAYVPLDPAYPEAALRFMLEDAQVAVVLTQTPLPSRTIAGALPVIYLDNDWASIAQQAGSNPGWAVDSDDLLYIIYTSGSTGRPKGIALPHRALVNLLFWHWSQLIPAAKTLQYASLCFDASFHEIFSALCSGGSIFLMEQSLRQDIAALARFIEKNDIQKIILPVVVLDQLAQEFCRGGTKLPELREVIVTGEQLQITRGIIQFFKQTRCSLHNHYGPSETHVVTALSLTGDPEHWPVRPSIGRPIGNTQIRIMDEENRHTPVGVTGELYIGGVSLARGYWNRPELTAERFIPHPFSNLPGGRMYRTGDLARWLPDGEIEFLGRTDDQVKIRGYRLELGELEMVLAQHPGVEQVAVTLREDQPGDKRLAAYVVTKNEDAASAVQLRTYLKERLPEYMVPSFIVPLPEMPLTANGKIDRRALPALTSMPGKAETEYHAPSTPIEELVAGIWAEVLGVPRVGTDDNFFDLGGHSLLAMQIIARASATFKREVSLKALFLSPTTRRFSEEIEKLVNTSQDRTIVAMERVTTFTDLPLTVNQEKRMIVEECLRVNQIQCTAFNTGSVLRFNGELQLAALERTLNEIVRRHEILRAVFFPANEISPKERGRRRFEFARTSTFEPGLFRHSIVPDAPLTLPLRSLEGIDEANQADAIQKSIQEQIAIRINYGEPPLLQALLLRIRRDYHLLVLVLPHLISDGQSMDILQREIRLIYPAFVEDRPHGILKLSHHFSDFAAWQHRYLNSPAVAPVVKYWANQWLQFASARLQLEDFPSALTRSELAPQLVLETAVIDQTATDSLRKFARDSNVTLYMLFLAALGLALHQHTKKKKIALWTNFANRTWPECEVMIGWFVNSHLLGMDFSANPTGEDLLSQIRSTVLAASAYQEIPTTHLWRVLGRTPTYKEASTFFDFRVWKVPNAQTAPESFPTRIDEVSLSSMLSEVGTSKTLNIGVLDKRDTIEFSLLFDKAVLSRSAMRQLLDQWRSLSLALPRETGLPISQLFVQTST